MIYVTGGTGFLGRHLIPALCRQNYSIRVLTRFPEDNQWLNQYPNVVIVKGDLTDFESIASSIKGSRIIIHAGGHFRLWGEADEFMSANVDGTRNMLEAARLAGVERFIHVSSIAVIGQPDPQNVIDETYPPSPADAYQKSKYDAEQIALSYFQDYQLPVIILRPGAYYGPLGEYAFNRLFFRDAMRGIIMQINGGRYIIFPAYISDVVQGILLAKDRAALGEVYNICGDWISHRYAFDIICDEAGLKWPRPPVPGWLGINASRILEMIARLTHREPFWPINLRSYVYNNWRVSNEKARRELGFSPTSFRAGARRTIAWYRAGQPDIIPEIECDG